MAIEESAMRCGYAAIIGAPNAGKSTLVNRVVGSKVSIVTHKVQTTRAIVRGIIIQDETQVILVDTPGIFAPKRRLDRAMVRTAWSGAHDADVVLVLIDAQKGFSEDNRKIMQQAATLNVPRALVLNKIDLVPHETLLALAATGNELLKVEATFMISALGGGGVAQMVKWIVAHMPRGHWLYPEDQISDLPMRMLAAEVTREKLYLRLHEELPYASTVETDSWKQQPDGSVRIEQSIFVERESQKKIVLGKGGQTIKAISMGARKEISEMIEGTVHLFLFVKVRESWADDPERYREMGLEFPRE